MEVLESRALLSGTFAVTDLNAELRGAAQSGLTVADLNNSGLAVLRGNGNFTYSISRNRFFPATSGLTLIDVNHRGIGVGVEDNGDVEIVGDGLPRVLAPKTSGLVNGRSETTFFEPASIDSNDNVTGTFVVRRGRSVTVTPEVFFAIGGSPVGFAAPFAKAAIVVTPRLNEAGLALTYNVPQGAKAGDEILDQAVVTQLNGGGTIDIGSMFRRGTLVVATALSQSTFVAGYYRAGPLRTGAFLFNTNTRTLKLYPQTNSAASPVPLAVDEAGVMTGTINGLLRRRGHLIHTTRAAIFNIDGTIQDLNDVAQVPAGATLNDARIDEQGSIIAQGTGSDGLNHAFLLTPVLVTTN